MRVRRCGGRRRERCELWVRATTRERKQFGPRPPPHSELSLEPTWKLRRRRQLFSKHFRSAKSSAASAQPSARRPSAAALVPTHAVAWPPKLSVAHRALPAGVRPCPAVAHGRWPCHVCPPANLEEPFGRLRIVKRLSTQPVLTDVWIRTPTAYLGWSYHEPARLASNSSRVHRAVSRLRDCTPHASERHISHQQPCCRRPSSPLHRPLRLHICVEAFWKWHTQTPNAL